MARLISVETPEERELRKRNTMLRRIRILAALCVMVILARIFIKDPVPPKAPDYARETVRYVPGMLDGMPASQRAKLSAIQMARLQKAEQEYKTVQAKKAPLDMFAKSHYRPSEVPLTNQSEEEALKQQIYTYAKRRRAEEKRLAKQEAVNQTQKMLVMLQNGGYLKAEQADQTAGAVRVRVDRSLQLSLPQKMVRSVSDNAVGWKKPVPPGFVEVQPANGITIVVSQESAKRISVRKNSYDEI